MKVPSKQQKKETDEDLITALREQTEAKQEYVQFEEVKENIEEFPGTKVPSAEPNPDNFEKEIKEEENPDSNDSEEKKEVQPPLMPFEVQAKMLVGFVDGLDNIVMPWLYQKAVFTAEEIKILKSLKKKLAEQRDKPETTIEPKELAVQQQYNDYKELCETIPFTDEEKQFLEIPLAAVLEKYKANLSPEFLLFAAILTVMGIRLVPLLNRI